MTQPRALKKGDRVRVTKTGLRHFGQVGTITKVATLGRWCWVLFDDGKDAPLSRSEFVALPHPRPRKKR